jgi:hypothetical protein
MLDDLDRIPWSTLEHAYGNAGDIPDILRAMTSSDSDRRAWAEDMLDMGPFHQGSLYSCTPYVVGVLLQLVQEEESPETAWIVEYVSRVVDAALWRGAVSEPHAPDPDQELELAYAAQILAEVRLYWPLVMSLLEHPDGQIRLALLRLLVLLQSDVPHLENVLAERLTAEPDDALRAATVFCFCLVADPTHLSPVQRMLEQGTESPMIRIAAGFGLIAALKEEVADSALAAFCEVIVNEEAALDAFEELYAEKLSPLGAPAGKDRLLDCLLQAWSSSQRSQLVQALLRIYSRLPLARSIGIRVGSGYYFNAMVQLAFPDGQLAPETTIRDLTDLQRRVLEAFQQYDMPSTQWNHYGPTDYRWTLGFDFRSEADFLAFMAGARPAKQGKP